MGRIKARRFNTNAKERRTTISVNSPPVKGTLPIFDMKKRYTGRASSITTRPINETAVIIRAAEQQISQQFPVVASHLISLSNALNQSLTAATHVQGGLEALQGNFARIGVEIDNGTQKLQTGLASIDETLKKTTIGELKTEVAAQNRLVQNRLNESNATLKTIARTLIQQKKEPGWWQRQCCHRIG